MKDRKTAILLCFFLGPIGVHRFYLGQTGYGIFYLLTLGLIGILPLADFIIWLLGSNEAFDKKYNSQAIQREQSQTQKEMLEALKNK
jgi:TM2 domain-containing membrane protein YozV|tara:strand:- start:156 stop:416 length:261 start_codon:yes stop_codon:yes gene_type:complete